jgi:hypothetical protein
MLVLLLYVFMMDSAAAQRAIEVGWPGVIAEGAVDSL